MSDFNQQIEDEIQKKGLNAPRVAKETIDDLFRQLEYVFGKVSETRVLCSAYLDGFCIADGFSSCVSAENFDQEIGMKIAQKNCAVAAIEKLWELEGYRLARKIQQEKLAKAN